MRAPWPRQYRPGKPFQWSPEELNMVAVWCAAMIVELSEAQPEVFRRAVEFMPSPIPGGGGERVSGSTDLGGPTPRYVIRGTEQQCTLGPRDEGEVAKNTRALVQGWCELGSMLEQMWKAQRSLDISDPELVRSVLAEKPRAGAGECANLGCKHWCSGMGEDRLKGGRCPPCKTYLGKHGVERPHALCHATEVGGCELCVRAA